MRCQCGARIIPVLVSMTGRCGSCGRLVRIRKATNDPTLNDRIRADK